MEKLSLDEVAEFTRMSGLIRDAHVRTSRHPGSRYVAYLSPAPSVGETCTITASVGVSFELPFSATFHADLARIGVFLNDHDDSPDAVAALTAYPRGTMLPREALAQILAAR